MDSDTEYCRQIVERYDRDRYILSLAAAAPARPGLWALFAFNHELAKTRESVRDIHAGHLRLAWWREALEGFYASGTMPAHGVAAALGRTIAAHNLLHDGFDALIDARATELDSMPPASLNGLAAFAGACNAPLFSLCADIMRVRNDTLADLGVAYGLVGIVRALPFYARSGHCVLPMPMLHEIGLMPEQFHHLASSSALSGAVRAITAHAQKSLARTKADDPFFKKARAMIAFYLRRIARAGHDPFAPRVCGAVPFLGLRLAAR